MKGFLNLGNLFGACLVITATFIAATYESPWIAAGTATGAITFWYVFMILWQEIMEKPENRALYALGLIFGACIVIGLSVWEFYRYCGSWFYFYKPWC